METESYHSVKLLDLLERSKALLAHAEAGDWQKVVTEEEVCRQLINTYFSDPSRLTDVSGIGQAIQELLQINDRLQTLAANARDQSKSELSTISEGRKAVNAYAQHAR